MINNLKYTYSYFDFIAVVFSFKYNLNYFYPIHILNKNYFVEKFKTKSLTSQLINKFYLLISLGSSYINN